jgi:hypothetical protein
MLHSNSRQLLWQIRKLRSPPAVWWVRSAAGTWPHLIGHACCRDLVDWPDMFGSFRLSAKHTNRKAATAVTLRIVPRLPPADRACLTSLLQHYSVLTPTGHLFCLSCRTAARIRWCTRCLLEYLATKDSLHQNSSSPTATGARVYVGAARQVPPSHAMTADSRCS